MKIKITSGPVWLFSDFRTLDSFTEHFYQDIPDVVNGPCELFKNVPPIYADINE